MTVSLMIEKASHGSGVRFAPPTPAKLRALKDLRDRQGDRLVVISDFLDDPAIDPVTDTSPAKDE